MPATDYVLKYNDRLKSRIPKMIPSKHVVTNKKNEEHAFYMNKPSVYLEYLMSDPVKNPMLSSLSDDTIGQYNCLQQGAKWREHPMFQNPMVTLADGDDVWVGDSVEMQPPLHGANRLLVSRFFKAKDTLHTGSDSYVEYAQGYLVLQERYPDNSTEVSLSSMLFSVPLSNLRSLPFKKDQCFLLSDIKRRFEVKDGLLVHHPTGGLLDDHVCNLWNGQSVRKDWKVLNANGDKFLKVVIAPLTLFTDDTSGNLSKQYNLFDSYVMTPAAMSYDARSSKNNIYFICTSNKKLNAVDMLPPLVDDLRKLEAGVPMYSVAHDGTVLVVAPLLLIQADNYRHSKLSMHKGSSAGFFCRKCLIEQTRNPNPKPRVNTPKEKREAMLAKKVVPLKPVRHKRRPRTLWDLFLMTTLDDDSDEAKELAAKGYGKNGRELFEELEAYNPLLDALIELLHTLPLGVGKSLLQVLLKTVLKKAELPKLQAALSKYRVCRAYSRNFRALVNHSGLFLGRDFKQLTQILPVVLRDTFSDAEEGGLIDLATKCFDSFGCLSSLAYMRNFTGDLKEFTSRLSFYVHDLAGCILKLDNYCIKNKKTTPTILSFQPKLHMLYHMVADVERFGMPVHYETEHGEMDLAVAFGKQFVVKHIVNGGSFLANYQDPVHKNVNEMRRVVGVSSGIKKFKEDYPDFIKRLLDYRENADNNDYKEASRSIKEGSMSLFELMEGEVRTVVFGVVTKVDKDPVKYTFQQYNVITSLYNSLVPRFCSFDNREFPGYLITKDNNLVMIPDQEAKIVKNGYITLTRSLDLFTKIEIQGVGTARLLNIHKYGSLWPLVEELPPALPYSLNQ
ncbi:unnamed protein product [Mucor hiemalis]